jgi:myo-inositol 2-dehydrogenase / D-chiro-inositol 1-dehydrogenase
MIKQITERRGFLGLLLVKPATAFGTQANSSIEIGLVGCGARGVWVGEMFREFAGARVVALHDVFADRVKTAREKLAAASARIYGGYDGYQDLVTSKVDAVAIESPPYCHPEQSAAASR